MWSKTNRCSITFTFQLCYKICHWESPRKPNRVLYADDVNTLAENLQTVRKNAEIFIKASKDIGLEVNSEKTKYIITLAIKM